MFGSNFPWPEVFQSKNIVVSKISFYKEIETLFQKWIHSSTKSVNRNRISADNDLEIAHFSEIGVGRAEGRRDGARGRVLPPALGSSSN